MSAVRNGNIQDEIISLGDQNQRDPLFEVLAKSCQYNVRIASVDKRSLIDVHGNKLIDFASCNYLSFDQEQDALLPAANAAAREYGVHTSRARLMGYHELFSQLERRLADFLGVEDSILFPNTTLAHIGIIPALMARGDMIFLDKSAHATMYQGAQMARDKGAGLVSFRQGDMRTLERQLTEHADARRKMICVDGVYSMTGDYAVINELIPLARKHNALLYIDDAHGFGFVGENPTESMPYGFGGNGIVKHFGGDYDNVMYVAGTAKNLGAAAAVVSVSAKMKEYLLAYARPLDYTHPSTPFCLGILDSALDLQQRTGDARRKKVYELTRTLVDTLKDEGFSVVNDTYFPIVSVLAGETNRLIEASRTMYEDGIFLTACPYPTMPKGQEALRITITSNHEMDQIEVLLGSLRKVQGLLRSAD
ncbi:aminotransferase class I/II-fold pyridoxal phosphate-dependent enzyme [Allokutzneria oryzae]|uniref:8-amino-7-oxononanoate synthase n=1 Tax=Allokutzneria oryzae TaxID=1378989 RepID=A0ABV5ZXE2_9PSEU